MLAPIIQRYRAAYADLPQAAWILCGVTLVNRLGTMVNPFLALYLTSQLNLPLGTSGIVLGLFGAGTVAGGYLGGWLSARLPSTHVQAYTLILEGGLLLLLPQIDGLYAISASLFLLGTASQAFRPANATAIVNACLPQTHARALALNRLALNIGLSIGPAIGGFLASHQYRWLFYVNGTTCLLAAAVVWYYQDLCKPLPSAEHDAKTRTSSSAWLRDPQFLAAMSLFFIGMVIFFQFESAFAVFMKSHYGMNEARFGLLFTVNTALIIAFEMLLVHGVARFNKLRIVGLGCFLVGLGFGILPLGNTFAFAVVVMTISTVGEMLALPVCSAWIAEHSSPQQRALYLGVHSSVFGLAIMTAPVVGLRLLELGPEVLWYGCLGTGVVVCFGFLGLAQRAPTSDQPN